MSNGFETQGIVEAGREASFELRLGDPNFCQIPLAILFDSSTSFIAPIFDHKQVYQLVLARLNAGGGSLLVVGHTDETGGQDLNQRLSGRRALSALAVLTGNTGDWETVFTLENWSNSDFQIMLSEVGLPSDTETIRQHREASTAGRSRRAILFGTYFQSLLGHSISPSPIATLSPATLGCGEQHILGGGDHRPSRRAEFFFFLANQSPVVRCDLYPDWLNPCSPFPLPVSVVNTFFVSGSGDDATGDGTINKPWRTFLHSLSQIAVLRPPGQHVTLNVLAGTFIENITLPSETSLEAVVRPRPEIRGSADAPVILINNALNSSVHGLKITQGRRSGIRIERSNQIEVTACQISDNFAPRGGGVAIIDAHQVTVENSTIENNVAGTIGTAIVDVDIDAGFSGLNTFDIQVGDAHGGGIYVANSEPVFIRGNQVWENKAILFGGGIAVDNRSGFDGVIEISNNQILCNQCSHGDLSPLNTLGINCNVSDMNDPLLDRMEDETAESVAARAVTLLHGVGIESGMGGGIALRHVSPRTQLRGNHIGTDSKPNRARRGGGVECFLGAYPALRENHIEFNLASDDGGGIAIDQFDPFLPRSQPNFLSFRRGTIFPRQTIAMIDNQIRFNRCISDGGGIYATGNPRVELTGTNTLIEGNRAGENGGGIRISYAAHLTATGARIINNQSNTIGTERDGGGGIAARNAGVLLQDCELSGNTANNFAGGAIFCTSAFEGGFNREGFVGNQAGQFDAIMRDDYSFGVRRYHFNNSRGSGNQATGPAGNSSGAGGFMYCVRVEGNLPIEIFIRGSGTAIGQNTSTFERSGRREKRGNVVLELSGQQQSGRFEDRVFISGDVPSVAVGGIVASTPPPDNHPVVVLRGPGLPIDHPTTFPYVFGAPPSILDVQPRFGPIAGGTNIVITGQGFLSGAEVSLGGSPATVASVTEMTIKATTPRGALGAVDVVVRNPDTQSDTVIGGFEYVVPPRISDVQPRTGPSLGGTAITVRGAGFLPGVQVLIGGRLADNVSLVSNAEITADTPPSATPRISGTVDVIVRNVDNQSDAVLGGFTYLVSSPRIIDVQPRSGPNAVETAVTISGADFLPGAQLFFGGQLATGINVMSSTEIVATTPIQPTITGPVDVEIRNLDGGSETVRGGYEYIP